LAGGLIAARPLGVPAPRPPAHLVRPVGRVAAPEDHLVRWPGPAAHRACVRWHGRHLPPCRVVQVIRLLPPANPALGHPRAGAHRGLCDLFEACEDGCLDGRQAPLIRLDQEIAVRPLPSVLHRTVRPQADCPGTFRTKTDADRWLTAVEADLSRGTWLDEQLGREPFGTYTRAWLRDHPKIGPRHRETCERNLRLHLAPLLDIPLRAMTPAVVRVWYASALRGNGGRVSIMQSYRRLRAVMNTTIRDGAITRNRCRYRARASIELKNGR